MEHNNTPFQQKLLHPIKLPSLVKNMHALLQTLADDTLNYQQIADVIKHYPEITARIIFLVNSPWSSPISPITNIEQACARLGTSIVKSISIAISIASSFDTRKCPYFNTAHFWTTSMLVAEGAGILASRLPGNLTNLEFEHTAETAGILHNIGLLWLAHNLALETDIAFQRLTDESNSYSVSESLKLSTGTDYCEVGGLIAKELNFPEILITTIEQHLNPDYQESSWEITLLIGSAAKMASAMHQQVNEFPTNSRLEMLGIDSANQKLIYQKLSSNYQKTSELAKTLFEG